jgi:hypothetical protein
LEAKESFNEDDIYTAMDQLTGHWVGLEKQLYQSAFPQEVRLVLCVASVSLRSAKKPHPGGISWVSCGWARETDEERKLPSQPQPAAAMAC